jgi:chromosome segregation ATPase
MAVVCCATPSELYLEETRSTLLFASRAKLVKTNAQINEVLDDRSIIRRLQRELALVRSQTQNGSGSQLAVNIAEWENLATSAGRDVKIANDKLKRVYTSILMNNRLDDTNVNLLLGVESHNKNGNVYSISQSSERQNESEKLPKKRCRHSRRLSDGNLQQSKATTLFATPKKHKMELNPSTDPNHSKKLSKDHVVVNKLSSSDELFMLRQAIVAKEKKVGNVKRQMDQVSKQLQSKDLDLVAANCSNDLLRSDRDEKSDLCNQMMSDIDKLKSDWNITCATHDAMNLAKESKILELQSKLQQQLDDRRILEETVDTLQDSKLSLERELTNTLKEKDDTIANLRNELESFQEQLHHATNVINVDLQHRLLKEESEKDALKALLESTTESLTSTVIEKDARITNLRNELESCQEQLHRQTNIINVDLQQCLLKEESEKDALKALLESSIESLESAEANVKSLTDSNNELAATVDKHEQSIETITEKYDIVNANLQKTNEGLLEAKEVVGRQATVISNLECVQRDLETTIQHLTTENNKLISKCAIVQNEVLDVKEQHTILNEKLVAVTSERDVAKSNASRCTDMVEVAEIKFDGLLITMRQNEKDMDQLTAELVAVKSEKAETDALVLQQKQTISDLESQLSSALIDRDAAYNDIANVKETFQAINVKYDELNNAMNHSNDETSRLMKENEKLNEMNKNLETWLADLDCKYKAQSLELLRTIDDKTLIESIRKRQLTELFNDASSKIDVLTTILHYCEVEKDTLSTAWTLSKELNSEYLANIEDLNEQNDSNERIFNDRLDKIRKEHDGTLEMLRSQSDNIHDAELKIEGFLATLQQSQTQLEVVLAERDILSTDLAISKKSLERSSEWIEQLTNKIETLTSEASCNFLNIQHVTEERDAALIRVQELSKSVALLDAKDQEQKHGEACLRQELEYLETQHKQCKSTIDSSQQIAEQITNCMKKFESKHRDFISVFDSAGEDDHHSESMTIVPTLRKVLSRLNHLTNEIIIFETKYVNQSEKLLSSQEELVLVNEKFLIANDSVLRLKDQMQSLTDKLQLGKTSYSESLEVFHKEKNKLTLDLAEAAMKIDQLNRKIDEITIENNNLQAKLSASACSEVNVGIQSENKELKLLLSNANNSIDEARMATREMTKELELKSFTLGSVRKELAAKENEIRQMMEKSASDLQLSEDVHKLMEERESLQRRLSEELDNRSQFEMEFKRRMSDEQRALIHEAEQTMHGLRMELESKSQALKRAETEAYAAREAKDDLEDQCRRTLDRSIQLQSQISALENENTRLRRISNRQGVEHESELSALRERMSLANVERQEHQLLVRDLEQNVTHLNKEQERIFNELVKAQEELKNVLSNNFEQRNAQLVYEVEQLNKEVAFLKESTKENVSPVDKVKQLEGDNDRLRQKLKSYVDRCEKLESSKLTKDKLEAIKKLMVCQSNRLPIAFFVFHLRFLHEFPYKADKSSVEQELKVAKQEIVHLQSLVAATRSDTLEDTEVTKLRFDKDAIENKLRKFGAQCQRLEDEKLRILQTLKTSKVVVLGDNIEQSIVALCDKVASLEEECDALAKYKNKAVSHQVELNTIQKQNAELSSKVFDLQKKIDNLVWTETGHKNLISSLRGDNEKLQYEVDHARKEADALRNQLRYLEQENLQLMIDYKAAKQKIHGLKTEINLLQAQKPIASIINIREDAKNSTRKPPKTPNDKENMKSNQIRRTEKETIVPTASISKSVRPSNDNDNRDKKVAARLGDAFAASEENTQECKQS